MANRENVSPNPAGLSRPWTFSEEMITEAAIMSKTCEDIPHAQHLLHIFSSRPDHLYPLEYLAGEMEATEANVLKTIRRIDQFCDAYGRASLIKKSDEGYKMDRETAKVLLAAWESWS
ncbi:hypothetical protein [Streptosporangium sp. NPDC049078]|uniref:hypothetical protein n=1 Tax=Streptosporangium sp. NPDC049078 TaxID=3155767 RepID=UPI0034207B6E